MALQVLVNGIALGSIYAVMAFGLAIVYGVMQVVNFAHGVLAVLAAYLAFQLYESWGLDPFASLAITIPLFFALGWLVYRVLLGKVDHGAGSGSMVVTFGLGIALEVLIILIWATNFRSISPAYLHQAIGWGAVRVTYGRLFAVTVAVAALLALTGVMNRTKMGKGIRAVMQDREAAGYVGIDVRQVCALTFAIAMASVAVGGTLLGTLYAFYPAVHLDWTGRLFAIVVLGGMGSIPGAFVGSYLVAMAEAGVSAWAGAAWAPLVSFSVIVLVLLLRPGGVAGVPVGGRA